MCLFIKVEIFNDITTSLIWIQLLIPQEFQLNPRSLMKSNLMSKIFFIWSPSNFGASGLGLSGHDLWYVPDYNLWRGGISEEVSNVARVGQTGRSPRVFQEF
jgi:hypothetical protein